VTGFNYILGNPNQWKAVYIEGEIRIYERHKTNSKTNDKKGDYGKKMPV
jgi:hypothetical protein